jgi:RNAse (barnase) inhibitor barstar
MKNIKVLKEIYDLKNTPTVHVALIDGEKNSTIAVMYQSFAETLHFPEHFGANLDALYDMLCDLTWFEEKGIEKIHIVLRNYDALLSAEEHDEKLGVLSVLRDTAEEWHWLEADEKNLDFELFIEPSTRYKKDLKEI